MEVEIICPHGNVLFSHQLTGIKIDGKIAHYIVKEFRLLYVLNLPKTWEQYKTDKDIIDKIYVFTGDWLHQKFPGANKTSKIILSFQRKQIIMKLYSFTREIPSERDKKILREQCFNAMLEYKKNIEKKFPHNKIIK